LVPEVEAASLLLVLRQRRLSRAQLEEVAVVEQASLIQGLAVGHSLAGEHWARLAALREEVAERF
jgi:hypothetical protein